MQRNKPIQQIFYDESDDESDQEDNVRANYESEQEDNVPVQHVSSDSEEQEDSDQEQDDDEEEQAQGEDEYEDTFVNERNAFERSGFSRNAYAETEEDMFLNNMENYARANKQDFNRSSHPFTMILINYPHPRCLNPAACFNVLHFMKNGKYIWDKNIYDTKIKNNEIDVSSSILYRYISLFNEFNR